MGHVAQGGLRAFTSPALGPADNHDIISMKLFQLMVEHTPDEDNIDWTKIEPSVNFLKSPKGACLGLLPLGPTWDWGQAKASVVRACDLPAVEGLAVVVAWTPGPANHANEQCSSTGACSLPRLVLGQGQGRLQGPVCRWRC